MDDKQGVDLTASTVDIDRYVILNGKHVYVTLTLLYSSCIRVVSSSRAGMGKTLFITRMSERLQTKVTGHNVLIQIPIHGPKVTTDSVMELLVKHQDTSHSTILHFDISPSVCINEAYTATISVLHFSQVLWQMDTILFSLLVQRGFCDSQGRVWRNHPTQLYAIEVTIPEVKILITTLNC